MYRLEIPELPPTLNQVISARNDHVKRRWRDEWKEEMMWEIKRNNIEKLSQPVSLYVTQFCKGNVRDADNAVISSKYFCDALEDLGLIENDRFIQPIILATKKGKENKQVFMLG